MESTSFCNQLVSFECGCKVGPQETFVLPHNVTCEGDVIGIHVIGDRATINMNDFTMNGSKDIDRLGTGIKIEDGVKDVTILDGVVKGFANGIECESDCHDLEVHNISFYEQTWHSIYLESSKGLTVSDCLFEPFDLQYDLVDDEEEIFHTSIALDDVENANIIHNDFIIDADTVHVGVYVARCASTTIERNHFLFERTNAPDTMAPEQMQVADSLSSAVSVTPEKKKVYGMQLFETSDTLVKQNCFFLSKTEDDVDDTQDKNQYIITALVIEEDEGATIEHNLFDGVDQGIYYFDGSYNNFIDENCFQRTYSAIRVNEYGLTRGYIANNAFVESVFGDLVRAERAHNDNDEYDDEHDENDDDEDCDNNEDETESEEQPLIHSAHRFGFYGMTEGGLNSCSLCPSLGSNIFDSSPDFIEALRNDPKLTFENGTAIDDMAVL